MPNISKKTRDLAILICLCSSSRSAHAPAGYSSIVYDLEGDLSWAARALDLAVDAWMNVRSTRRQGYDWPPDLDAEAAQILVEGWCPGDELERLQSAAYPADEIELPPCSTAKTAQRDERDYGYDDDDPEDPDPDLGGEG